MKKLLGMVICLVFLSSFQSKVVSVCALPVYNTGMPASVEENEHFKNLIIRSTGEWISEGYTVMTYNTFKYSRILPENVMNRFQQNLTLYANNKYDKEQYAFVIYKSEGYGTITYRLKALEKTDRVIPNKYIEVDKCVLVNGQVSPFD